jgi:VWFA-related protein
MRIAAKVSLFLLIFVVAVPPARSQQALVPRYGEELEVRLYNLDVIVTDKAGKPARGLTKDDFIVLENNAPQEISNFSFYDISSSTTTLDGAMTEIVSGPESGEVPPPRRFVFFIDEMAIQGSARNTLKKQAATLLRAMRPGDMAAVVRPTASAQFEQHYSSDPDEIAKALNAAIDSCNVSLTAPAFAELRRFRQAMEAAQSPVEVAVAKETYVEQQRTRVQHRIGQLRALVASLGGAEEKKVLVLITSGLNAQPGREVYSTDEQLGLQEMRKPKNPGEIMRDAAGPEAFDQDPTGAMLAMSPFANGKMAMQLANQKRGFDGTYRHAINDLKKEIDDLGRTAAAEGIVIYSLTPEIPLFLDTGRGADARTDPGASTIVGDIHLSARAVVPAEMLNQLLTYEGETLQSFADKTGGRWFRGSAVIDDTFRALHDDLQVYYSIAYRGRGAANKPRKVLVNVKNRPDLKVRTRSEVIDHTAGDMASRVIAGLLYPRNVDDLKMAVRTNAPTKEGKKYTVPLEVVIPIDKITFQRSADGQYRGRVAVHYAAAAEKEFVSYGRQEQMIELTPEQYRQMLRIRYRYKSNITVPRGKIRIALGVVDAASKMSSLQTVNVTAQ